MDHPINEMAGPGDRSRGQSWIFKRRLIVSILIGWTLAIGVTGCRQDSRRGRTQAGTESLGPTIGHDLRRWPAGTTVPATGLGVDLVESKGLTPGQGRGPSWCGQGSTWRPGRLDPERSQPIHRVQKLPQPIKSVSLGESAGREQTRGFPRPVRPEQRERPEKSLQILNREGR